MILDLSKSLLCAMIGVGMVSAVCSVEGADVVSPLVSYQFQESISGEAGQSNVVSPVVSYLFNESPEASELIFSYSPLVSYDFILPPVRPDAGGLTISGPRVIRAGSQAQFEAVFNFPDGSPPLDVSGDVRTTWEVLGPGINISAAFFGPVLTTGIVDQPIEAIVRASYADDSGGIASENFLPVTITPGFSVEMNFSRVYNEALDQWDLWFVAGSRGGVGAVTYEWDFDGDGQFDDGVGQRASSSYAAIGQTLLVGVRGTNQEGALAINRKNVVINKRPELNEPDLLYPTTAPRGGRFFDSDGDDFIFDQDRVENGLIVIVHGLNNSGRHEWVQNMRNGIIARLSTEERPIPNVVIYDWEEDANPSQMLVDEDALIALPYYILNVGTVGIFDFLIDIIGIRPNARDHGERLAEWIWTEANAEPPRVSISKPIHLIGHSAGGFVVGECAHVLKKIYGIDVDLVTALDTPLPVRSYFDDFPDPGISERYISSVFGSIAPSLEFHLGAQDLFALRSWSDAPVYLIEPNEFYRREIIPVDPLLSPVLDTYRYFDPVLAHSYSHIWYLDQTVRVSGTAGDTGFELSPFLSGESHLSSFASRKSNREGRSNLTSMLVHLAEFDTFGDVVLNDGRYLLTEQNNVGIFKDFTIPLGAVDYEFRYQFLGEGDGDFLAVYWNEQLVYVGSENSISRNNVMSQEIPLLMFRGQTGRLSFKLVSRGNENSTMMIESIGMTTIEDPDFDGLNIEEELGLGTDPLVADTDKDRLSDFDEVRNFLTNPMISDTDGDGHADGDEITAKTDPTSPDDYLQISDLYLSADGGVTLKWPSKIDTTYRLLRSEDLDALNFMLIGEGMGGVGSEMMLQDFPPSDKTSFFYWIEAIPD